MLRRRAVDKLFRNPNLILWLCIPIGTILFVFATFSAVGIAEGEYHGSYFYLVFSFGLVPFISVWLSPFTYPFYAALLLWDKYRTLLIVLAIQNSIWLIGLIKVDLLPSELRFVWTKELAEGFTEPVIYMMFIGPLVFFQSLLIYQAVLGIKSKADGRR